MGCGGGGWGVACLGKVLVWVVWVECVWRELNHSCWVKDGVRQGGRVVRCRGQWSGCGKGEYAWEGACVGGVGGMCLVELNHSWGMNGGLL